MKIESMPNRISMNVTLPKQTQDKPFGEKLAMSAAQATSLLGSVLPQSPIISAAVAAATGVTNAGTAGTIAPAFGNSNSQMPNLTSGAGTNPGVYNTDIASMSAQNAQMLQVQMSMQRENTMFSSISNVLKTKHDTVKNSISNIR